MKIGLIADDFTRINLELESEIKIVNLTPLSWRFELALNSIDVLLVESAWQGFKHKWQQKIANYAQGQFDSGLGAIINYCKRKKIPTVFWNKEDPVNYERFKHNLEHFDVCLTTERDLIGHYKKNFANLADVSVAPFFFQPKLHNPVREEVLPALNEKVIFCGGLYQKEFPNRAQRLIESIDYVGQGKVVVFDRFNGAKSGWSAIGDVTVKSSFSYTASKKYYQSGLAQLNVNSLDGSETMFSRRMLELVASGSKVIDLTQFKGRGLLSPHVIQVSNKHDMLKALEQESPPIDFDFLVEKYSAVTFINTLKKYT